VENCEAFVAQSKLGRKQIAGKNLWVSKVVKWKAEKPIKTFGTQTEGIDGHKLQQKTAAG
jgi:hypothetical protein